MKKYFRTLKLFVKKILIKTSPIYRKLLMLELLQQQNQEQISQISTTLNRVDTSKDNISNYLKEVNNTQYKLGTKIDSLINLLSYYNEKDYIDKKINTTKDLKISIICLIYKSTAYAKAVYDSLYKYTPELKSGEAELLFVANDASKNVLNFLKKENYNFVINNNQNYSEEELFKLGYGIPTHINRVYKGYNYGIQEAKGDIVVLINSDNMFSPDWLKNLRNKLDEKKIICSQLVERMHPIFSIFPTAIHAEFGSHPRNFKEKEFLLFAKTHAINKITPGGSYMPSMIYKKNLIKVGLYPEGNIAGRTKEEIIKFGDEFLYDKLKSIGVEHYTACDSIVYHFKEGERED